MEIISKALVAGSLQSIAEEPNEQHKAIAKALVDVGGYREHPPGNRAERRQAEAKKRHKAGKARAERNRRSRGRVPA